MFTPEPEARLGLEKGGDVGIGNMLVVGSERDELGYGVRVNVGSLGRETGRPYLWAAI